MELSAEKYPDQITPIVLTDDAFLAILEHLGPQYRCLLAVNKVLDALIKPQLNLRFFARHQKTVAIENISWFLRAIETQYGCRPSLPEDCFQTLKQIANFDKSSHGRAECQHDAAWYLQNLAPFMSRAQRNQVRAILCQKYPYFLILEHSHKDIEPLMFEGWHAVGRMFKTYSSKTQESLIANLYRFVDDNLYSFVDDKDLRVRDAALKCLLKICAYQNYPERITEELYNKLEALLQKISKKYDPSEKQVILSCLRDITPHIAQKQRIFALLLQYHAQAERYRADPKDNRLKLAIMTRLVECSAETERRDLCVLALNNYQRVSKQKADARIELAKKSPYEPKTGYIGYYPAFELSVLALFYFYVDQELRGKILEVLESVYEEHLCHIYAHYPYNPFCLLDWDRKYNLIQQYTQVLIKDLDLDRESPEGSSITRLYLEAVSGLLKPVTDETELEQAKAYFLSCLSSKLPAERNVALYVFLSCADRFDKTTQEGVALLIKEQSLTEDKDGTVSWQALQADVTRYCKAMIQGHVHIQSLRGGVYAPLTNILIRHYSLADISHIFNRLNQALENCERYEYLNIMIEALSQLPPEAMSLATLDALLESYEAYLQTNCVNGRYNETVCSSAIFWMLPLFLSDKESESEEKIRTFLAKRCKDISLLPSGVLPLFLRFSVGEHAIAIPTESEAPTPPVARLLCDWRQGLRLQEPQSLCLSDPKFQRLYEELLEKNERAAKVSNCTIL